MVILPAEGKGLKVNRFSAENTHINKDSSVQKLYSEKIIKEHLVWYFLF